MPRRYRHSRDLTDFQRRRIIALFVGPLLIWSLAPAFLVSVVVAAVIEGKTESSTDTRSWTWIAKIAIATFASGSFAGMIGFALLMRHLLRYRTSRKGRISALCEFLRPSDGQAGFWRRLYLRLYGVRDDDLQLFREMRPFRSEAEHKDAVERSGG